jgi:hypothetical protein
VILTSPVFDDGSSQNIFVGGSDGNLYCVSSAGAPCSVPSVNVGTGPILDAPIVDSTEETVFAASNNFQGTAAMTQVTTALGSQVIGEFGPAGTDQYNGAFDNAYFTNVATGHMYFCGNATTADTPTLWRVTFDSNGTLDGIDSGSLALVNSGNTGTDVDCTPLTEVYNSSQNVDYLFVGVKNHGSSSGTPNCSDQPCIMSFSLPMISPFTFPTSAIATVTSNLGSGGASGMIIDNVSAAAGASQIYFGNLQVNTGVQLSQSALK